MGAAGKGSKHGADGGAVNGSVKYSGDGKILHHMADAYSGWSQITTH
jgi:hypothetical protein